MEFASTGLAWVGIVPLSYNADYVEKGPPIIILKGDLWFLAMRMGLAIPLLPIATKYEIAIFTKFMQDHPKPTDAHFITLAKLYKQKADGKTIFPKLPSMVKSYFNQWKRNQEIKASEENVGAEALRLREQLFKRSTCAAEYHIADIIKAVQDAPLVNQQSRAFAGPLQHTGAAQATRSHIPPVVAPMRKEYVKPHEIKSQRRCTWAPFCKHTIDVCGGSNKQKCKDHHIHNDNHTDEELKQAKPRMQNEEKAQRTKAKRKNPEEIK
jgi:hypothetical protein